MIKHLALLCFLLASSSAFAAPAIISGQASIHQNGATSSTTVAVTLPSTVGSGHALFVSVGTASATDTIVSITDDKGNTYTVADQTHNTIGAYTWVTAYIINVANAPQTITATWGSSNPFSAIMVDEASGIATSSAIDGHSSQKFGDPTPVGTGANAVTSGSITTTVNGDIIYSSTVDCTSLGLVNGTGFTAIQSVASTFYSQSLIQSSAGSIAGTLTAVDGTSSDRIITSVVALQPASGPPSLSHNQMLTGF